MSSIQFHVSVGWVKVSQPARLCSCGCREEEGRKKGSTFTDTQTIVAGEGRSDGRKCLRKLPWGLKGGGLRAGTQLVTGAKALPVGAPSFELAEKKAAGIIKHREGWGGVVCWYQPPTTTSNHPIPSSKLELRWCTTSRM